jgi:hypothetical protein
MANIGPSRMPGGIPPTTGPTFPTGAPGMEQGQPTFFSRLMQALSRLNGQQQTSGGIPGSIPGQTPPYGTGLPPEDPNQKKKKGGILGGLSKLKNTGGGLDQFKPPQDINAPAIGPSQMFTRYPNQ